jgi:DNA segregation ATPase FtsK/SpoIIIE, S-DNA-T family
MAKNKKTKIMKNHPEAKGLFLAAFVILFLISLISFTYADSRENYLGIIGYSIAWISTSFFGLGGYLIALFIGYLGWQYLSFGEVQNLKFKIFSFLTLLISCCILLNIYAELYPAKASLFAHKIFTDTIYKNSPTPHFLSRFNLGGIPFYFIYKDLPFVSLQKLLSNVGTILLFSTTAIVSFLLLTNIRIVPESKNLFLSLRSLCSTYLKNISSKVKNLSSLLADLLRRIFSIEKEEVNISYQTSTNKIISKSKAPLKEPLPKKTTDKESLPEVDTKVIISRDTPLVSLKNSLTSLKKNSSYHLPSPTLLSSPPKVDAPQLMKELKHQAEILEDTLNSFGIKAKVGEINCGPTITSFEVHPSIGVKVQKIQTLEKDIALNLEAKSIRILAPIPGKAAVGVEIPSIHPQPVSLKEMLIHYQQSKKKQTIPLLLGKTVSGDHVIADLIKMPHLLIAGATGSGKSVCINTIVMSILMNMHPEELKLIMIDPKKVELTQYSNLPHMIAPVITEPHGAYAALHWLVAEMQKRYDILKQLGLRNITAFNHRKIRPDFEASLSVKIPEKMEFIVAIIDEFADLMMVSSTDLETPIARIAQMARAVGIHLILATQRPSREVITGIIKANFPSRIAFKVASRINSQIILDETGAEALLGNGDLLFLPPGSSHLVRAQGAYISDEDISNVVTDINSKNPTSFLVPSFDAMKKIDTTEEGEDEPRDKLYDQALTIVLQTRNASTTFLQRKLKIGYARAASLIDELEANKVIGPQEGSKPRRILSTMDLLDQE